VNRIRAKLVYRSTAERIAADVSAFVHINYHWPEGGFKPEYLAGREVLAIVKYHAEHGWSIRNKPPEAVSRPEPGQRSVINRAVKHYDQFTQLDTQVVRDETTRA
jgi:hypothetical protein